jgi:hypothetical protein
VDDRGQLLVLGVELIEQRLDRLAVGGVASDQRDARAELHQLRVGTLSAGEHEVLGPSRGQPPGHPRAECSSTAGHEDGAVRLPGLAIDQLCQRCALESAHEHPGVADRQLVLARLAAEQREQATRGLGIEQRG